jgi:hypothetical protein
MKDFWKKLGLSLLIFAVLAILLDYGYISSNLKYIFFKPKPVPAPTVLTPAPKGEPNMLSIDSLGVKAPIQYVDTKPSENPTQLENDFQAALINGVVHYPGTVLPGQYGNSYIFGHSSDNAWSKGHFKTVFAVLPQMQKGALIEITDPDGNSFTYVVTDSFKVSKTEVKYITPNAVDQNGNKIKQLTLQTSYPVGTSLARWIVLAEIRQVK